MKEIIPIFWANQEWCLEDEALKPIKNIDENHPNWTDYSSISGTTAPLFAASNPLREYRELLHHQILKQLLVNLSDDRTQTPTCVLTHGGIASGKTSVIELWIEITSKNRRYRHLDFDRVKTLIPEYSYMRERGIKAAAEFVQTESAKLAGRALKRAIRGAVNIIYEGSLSNLDQITERIREMKRKGFTIIVLSSHVSETKGQERANGRYLAGGRFVRPAVIQDTYLSCPRTLVQLKGLVDLIFLADNEIDDQPARPILQIKGNHVEIFDDSLYAQYLRTVGSNNTGDMRFFSNKMIKYSLLSGV